MGIGTNDPKEALHVNGNIRGNHESGALRIQTDYGYVSIGPYNNSFMHFITDREVFYFNKELHVNSGIFNAYDSDLTLQTDGTTALTILNSNSNVGIGTTSPQRTLSVAGYIRSASDASETNYIELWHGGSHGFINKEGIGDLDFKLNGVSRLALTDDGLLQVKGPGAKVTTPNGDSDQWNSAYGWGNHNDAGYVISGANATLGTINSGSITSSGILSAHGLSTSSNLYMNDFSIQNVRNLRMQDFDDDTGGSDNKYRLLARDGAFQFNNGGVVVGGYGDNTWTDLADGTLIIKEGLAIGQTSIEAGYDADINGNVRVRGTMVSGVIGSSNEKLVLQTSGVDAITINNTTQKVTTHADLNVLGEASITGNLNIIGDLVFGQGINNDPQAPKLLALDAHNKMVYHKLNDVRNPWSLRFVRNVFGTGVDCMEITDSTGLVVQVDILDIHGNLLLGNNGYIDDRDDELSAEDQIWAGDHNNQRDDWIHIAERIELSSNSSVGEGVVIFGKNTTSTQFLNLTQDGNDSYLANSSSLSEYFLKATDRNVILGGNLTMPVGSTATLGQVSTTSHGSSADWHSAASTLTNNQGNWDDAYKERGSQIDGKGLTWDPATKDLHIQVGNGLSFNASNELKLDRLTITDLGNVGIGITTPDRTLSVDGVIRGSFDAAETEYLEFGHGGGNAFINMSGDGNMDFRYNNTNLITVRSNGELDLRNHDLENVDHGYFSSISSDALSFTTLPTGGTTADEVLVVANDGTVKSIASSELGEESPWSNDGVNLSYNAGTVSTTGLISNVANPNDLVFIGQQNGTESFRLFGNGIVEAKEVVVSLEIWPDYVFEEDYDLRPLEEVEAFVKENNHLPDVPSEEEVADEGVKVGEMEAILLQKVEELTLYLIDQNKQLKEQSELIQEQAQLIKKLQEKID